MNHTAPPMTSSNTGLLQPDDSSYIRARDGGLPISLPTRGASRFRTTLVNLLPALLLIASFPFVLGSDVLLRGLLAACVFYALCSCRTATTRIIVVFSYLCVMGGLRRWLIPSLGFPSIDALLIVVPAFTIIRFLSSAFSRQLPLDTRLAKTILWLIVFMAAEVFNPLQGGLEVGIAGVMFYIVPVLWYFEARQAAVEGGVDKFLKTMAAIVVVGVLYATYQWFYGFTAGEEMWARAATNLASTIGSYTRPMSFFNHSGEYVRFAALLTVLCMAAWIHHRKAIALIPVIPLVVAVFVIGSRGSLLNILATTTAVFAVQGRTMRSWIPRGVLAVVIAVVGLVWSLRQVEQQEFTGKAEKVVNHTVGGLLNPLDRSKSTAGVHTDMALSGFTKAIRNPLGTGLGSTTLAAAKFGGNLESTEIDISNLYVSLGLIGGTLYVWVCCLFMYTSFRLWHETRKWTSLCLLVILIFSHFQYLNSGLYAQTMFVWTCIGLMDGLARKARLA